MSGIILISLIFGDLKLRYTFVIFHNLTRDSETYGMGKSNDSSES